YSDVSGSGFADRCAPGVLSAAKVKPGFAEAHANPQCCPPSIKYQRAPGAKHSGAFHRQPRPAQSGDQALKKVLMPARDPGPPPGYGLQERDTVGQTAVPATPGLNEKSLPEAEV